MYLLAGYALALHLRSGETDMVIGADVAGRDAVEVEGLIGFFINQLPLRTDLSGEPTFGDLLGRIRQMMFEAHAHQDMPFDRLVEELNPERALNLHPIFQTKFMFQNTEQSEVRIADLMLTPFGDESDEIEASVKLDLQLDLVLDEKTIYGYIAFKTDLFEPDTIQALGRSMLWILEQAAANPELRLADFREMVTAKEQEYQTERRKNLKNSRLSKLKNMKGKPKRRFVG